MGLSWKSGLLDLLFPPPCIGCLGHPPAFDRARAILRYDEVSRSPILALKHADRLDPVPGFLQWLERAGRELIAGSDLIHAGAAAALQALAAALQ
jgi:predicted amidophosphoribosyltransferase